VRQRAGKSYDISNSLSASRRRISVSNLPGQWLYRTLQPRWSSGGQNRRRSTGVRNFNGESRPTGTILNGGTKQAGRRRFGKSVSITA
jgi:hypothetical protein